MTALSDLSSSAPPPTSKRRAVYSGEPHKCHAPLNGCCFPTSPSNAATVAPELPPLHSAFNDLESVGEWTLGDGPSRAAVSSTARCTGARARILPAKQVFR
jgi:hypothetical protein